MRYLVLVLINLPIILLALLNIITQFKLNKMDVQKFRSQLILWVAIFIVLILSFPTYNLLTGNPILDASELSLFDIVQTTAIIFLIYAFNRQRQALERSERRLKDLHQELSIKLSKEK